MAVAGELIPWAPWAQDPAGAYTFTLPSGATCEVRLGNVDAGGGATEDRVEAELATWFDSVDVMAIIGPQIDERIEQVRHREQRTRLSDGSLVDSGYGTEHYDADVEYDQAVTSLVEELVFAEIERRGYADDVQSFEGNGYCPGLDG